MASLPLLPFLRNLYCEWWRNSTIDLTTANAIISLPGLGLTDILSYTTHRFLIRQEYIFLFNRLVLFCATAPRWHSRGIIITGQPGIGKSIFLLYTLLRCLQDGQPVLFHMMNQTFTIFANGVSQVDPACLLQSVTTPICALIDSEGRQKVPPPDELLHSYFICPVFTTSPDSRRYHNFMQDRAAVVFVMDPWSDDELSLGVSLAAEDLARVALYQSQLSQVKDLCGPVIRDILSTLLYQSPHPIQNCIKAALGKVNDYDRLVNIYTAFLTSTSPEVHESHALVLMRRELTDTPEAGDNVLLEFKSPTVAELVWNALCHLEYDSALRYLNLFSSHSALSAPGGWAFENLAHRHLTKNTPMEIYLPPLLELAHTAGVRYTSQDYVSRGFLPIWKREVVFYAAAEEVQCNLTRYYIPRRSNNPLFDALFFGPNITPLAESTTQNSPFEPNPNTYLDILQMSTATIHGGSEKGVDIISEILRMHPGVQPIYVLVVPRQEGRTWKMPSNWYTKCRGPVYCQTIPLVRSS
ncbi:hypothetical protein EDD18DRAFT_1176064 [Armillaria luteobubalina]|uniref:Uncharacterized protein n=1 Tax=Armillaria luteobubalina TaxID=153913 RepID=A0AA39Q0Y0_9AGAR|nr:hypothetical protein EDD18DRAFT_1176064 [Armillaria luteobubalina]